MVSSETAGWTSGLAAQLGVPGDVGLVYEFVNSVDHRSFSYHGHRNVGGDEFVAVDGLRRWLRARRLITDADPVPPSELAMVRGVRARLRDAIAAHGSGVVLGEGEFAPLHRMLPMDVAGDEHGRLALRPRSGGVRGALGLVLIEAVTASATRRWQRLKMCAAADCRWIFFDTSKPGSGRWCETEICGNRVKKTNQRARRHHRGIDAPR